MQRYVDWSLEATQMWPSFAERLEQESGVRINFEKQGGLFLCRGEQGLAATLGMKIPVRPQRGQLIVTERLAPMLPYPISGIRQTHEGSFMIGVSNEEVGFDTSVTADVLNMKRSYDFAILGAGPAGLSAAAALPPKGSRWFCWTSRAAPGDKSTAPSSRGERSGWPPWGPITGTAAAWLRVFTGRGPTTSKVQPSGRSRPSAGSTTSGKERPDASGPNACSLQPALSKGRSRSRGGPFRESWAPVPRMCSSSQGPGDARTDPEGRRSISGNSGSAPRP